MFLTRFFHAFCYAVGAEKALIQAALRVRFSRGKGVLNMLHELFRILHHNAPPFFPVGGHYNKRP